MKNKISYGQENENDISISIIIPVYNTEKYIVRCIESVFRQNIRNFEIIVIDDCSSDSSYDILKLLAKKYNQIKLYRNDKNKGAGFTKNKGLRLSTGKYICFLDSDDFLLDGALGNVFDIAEEMQCDDVFYGNMTFGENQEVIIQNQAVEVDQIYEKGILYFEKMLDEKQVTVAAWHHFFRKSCINKSVAFLENSVNDDWKFTAMLYQNIGKMVVLKNKYYMYMQQRAGSITNRSKMKSLICETFFNAIDIYNESYSLDEVYERVRQKCLQYMMVLVQNEIETQKEGWKKDLLKINNYMSQHDYFAAIYEDSKFHSQYGNIDMELIKKLKTVNDVYIYGAGAYGIDVMRILKTYEVQIKAFIVSSGEKRIINSIPQYKIDDVEFTEDSFVIVAVSDKYKSDVCNLIKKIKIFNYGFLITKMNGNNI